MISAQTDTTTFQNVDHVIVIQQEPDQINATAMVFVSVIEMESVFARQVLIENKNQA